MCSNLKKKLNNRLDVYFMQEKKSILKNSIIIFIICLIVRTIESIFIRTDETIFAELFINKVFGIVVLFILLHLLKWKWEDDARQSRTF